LPPRPTPPVTVNAPVAVPVDCVEFVIETALVVVVPRFVTDCNVLVSLIVTSPVLVDIEISVPAIIDVTLVPVI
jgi:hypothetical protein